MCWVSWLWPAPSASASCGIGPSKEGLEAGLKSGRLEHPRFKRMAFQEAVELGAVAPRKARRLGHVAPGDLQDPHQVVALEGLPRLVQRRQRAVGNIQCLPD